MKSQSLAAAADQMEWGSLLTVLVILVAVAFAVSALIVLATVLAPKGPRPVPPIQTRPTSSNRKAGRRR